MRQPVAFLLLVGVILVVCVVVGAVVVITALCTALLTVCAPEKPEDMFRQIEETIDGMQTEDLQKILREHDHDGADAGDSILSLLTLLVVKKWQQCLVQV